MRKRYLILIIMAVTFGLTLMMVENYTTELVRGDSAATDNEPDYYGEQLSYRSYAVNGELASTLLADSSRHLPGRGETRFANPKVETLGANNQPWTVQADQGILQDRSETLTLEHNVRIESSANGNRSAMVVTTDALTYHTDTGVASTERPIHIVTDASETHATGMRADIHQQRLELNSKVSTRYDRP